MLRKILIIILVLFLVLDLSGCGPLKRKFTRKKKEKKPTQVYFEAEKYTKELNAVLYKRHYTFWKTWQQELINKIGENYNRDRRNIEEIVNNLQDMKKLLAEKKANELQLHIDGMEGIREALDDRLITDVARKKIVKKLEASYRRIKREFAYKRAKDYILPDVRQPAEESSVQAATQPTLQSEELQPVQDVK